MTRITIFKKKIQKKKIITLKNREKKKHASSAIWLKFFFQSPVGFKSLRVYSYHPQKHLHVIELNYLIECKKYIFCPVLRGEISGFSRL